MENRYGESSMLPARRMAQMVYYQLIERTAGMQIEVAQQITIGQFFGPDALPVNKARRSHLHILKSQREDPDRVRLQLNKEIQDNIAVIEEFERLFAEAEDADIKAFAEAMAAQWKGASDERSNGAEKGSEEPAS
jgi:hypothetical protein